MDYQANFWSAQTANHAELILPYVDTVLRLVPLAKKRAALEDWSLGGRPHIHGGGVQCMGCGGQGQASPSIEGDWDNCGGCPPGFGGFKGLEFPSAMGPFEHQTLYVHKLTSKLPLLCDLWLYLTDCLYLQPTRQWESLRRGAGCDKPRAVF